MPDLLEANRAINEVYKRAGARIAQVRKGAGLTQADLGAVVGLKRSSIANLEAGSQRSPLYVYLAIAQAFGLSLADLLGDGPLPTLAERLPEGGALAVKRARAVLAEASAELARHAGRLEEFDA